MQSLPMVSSLVLAIIIIMISIISAYARRIY